MSNQFENVIKEFDKYSYYTEDKIARGIEEHRKGQFALVFKGRDGRLLHGVRVRVKQISHEFNFGCNLFCLDHYEGEEQNALYEEKFKKIFNYGVVPLYWDTLEPREGEPRFSEDSEKVHRRPPADRCVRFCRENGIRMKGHCLVYNSFNPSWMSEDSREIKIQIDKRLRAIGERYGGDFTDVDVINEMYRIYKNCYAGMGNRNLQITDEEGHEKWAFDLAKKHFPHSRLFWNEGLFEVLGETSYSGFRSYYYMAVKEALAAGAPVEGIGIQFHANGDKDRIYKQCHQVCHPLRLIDALERYGDFGLPISISEISVPSFGHDPDDEELQAALTERLMKLWFGRKHVDSIVWWNLVDNTAFGDENRFHSGLLRNDCTEKPVFRVMDELINKKWKTNISTTANDTLYFTGFYGDYEIEATYNGKTVTKDLRLWKDNTGYDNRLRDFRAKKIII